MARRRQGETAAPGPGAAPEPEPAESPEPGALAREAEAPEIEVQEQEASEPAPLADELAPEDEKLAESIEEDVAASETLAAETPGAGALTTVTPDEPAPAMPPAPEPPTLQQAPEADEPRRAPEPPPAAALPAPAPQAPAPARKREAGPDEAVAMGRGAASADASAPADASAFAPKKLRRGTPELVQVVIHQPKDLKAVIKAARKSDPRTEPAPQGMAIGDVALGASIGVALETRGVTCDGTIQRRTWSGEPIHFSFSAEAEDGVKQAVFIARVFIGDAQIGVIGFTRQISGPKRNPASAGDAARLKRHRRVFLSYSSKDRETVAAIATATIVVLSTVNLLGARLGSAVQSVFAILKVGALAALIVAAFTVPGGSFAHLAPAGHAARNLGSGAASVIWAYDGWVAVSMVAGEVVSAEKAMRRIIVGGMLVIVVLYAGANIGYFYALPVEAMAAETGGVPQRIMSDRLGPIGAPLIAAAILCSVFGALNGNILAKPRVAYALARDGLTFGFLGRVHPRWSTPYAAILIQSAMAIVLVALLRDFDALTTYFVVVEWSALLFAVAAVMVLRRRQPDRPRPFRTPGYPWVPLAFLAGTAAGLVAIVAGEVGRAVPNYAPLWGLLLAVAGFPVFHAWRALSGSAPAPRGPA